MCTITLYRQKQSICHIGADASNLGVLNSVMSKMRLPLPLGSLIGIGIPSLLVLVILIWYIVWRCKEKSHKFNAYTRSYEAIDGMNLHGKTAIVTGNQDLLIRELQYLIT